MPTELRTPSLGGACLTSTPRRVDVVERRLLGALHRVGVGAGHDLRRLALVHVGFREFQLPSFVTLPSSTLARRFMPSEPMIRRRSATGLKSTVAMAPARQHGVELGLHGGLAGCRVDRRHRAVGGEAVEHAVGRAHVDAEEPPVRPETFIVLSTFLRRDVDDGDRVVAHKGGHGLRLGGACQQVIDPTRAAAKDVSFMAVLSG